MAKSLSNQKVASIYQDQHRRMIRFCQKRGLNHQDAEDLAHDAFLRLMKSGADFECDRSIVAYLFAAIRSMLIDRSRSADSRRRETSETRSEQAMASVSVVMADAIPTHDLAVSAVEVFLNDYCAKTGDQTVRLHYLSGLSATKIGEERGLPVGSITSHLCRFRKTHSEEILSMVEKATNLVYA
jgi:RNA polymerase sigma factor (sigma-70 family)